MTEVMREYRPRPELAERNRAICCRARGRSVAAGDRQTLQSHRGDDQDHRAATGSSSRAGAPGSGRRKRGAHAARAAAMSWIMEAIEREAEWQAASSWSRRQGWISVPIAEMGGRLRLIW